MGNESNLMPQIFFLFLSLFWAWISGQNEGRRRSGEQKVTDIVSEYRTEQRHGLVGLTHS